MTVRTICLHGPESTGKSTLAPRLAQALGGQSVAEYGRTYTEQHGTGWTMDDLVAIAEGHDAETRAALAQGPLPVILDTDPLMTEAWAEMLYGYHDGWFDAWGGVADLYLLFDIDLPWIDDGIRIFDSVAEQRRFFDISRAVLERRSVPWALVGGKGEARYRNALAAIAAADRSLRFESRGSGR